MKTRILISSLIVSLIFTSAGLILPKNAVSQSSQDRLKKLINQYKNLNLKSLIKQLNDLSSQMPGSLSGQYNTLLGNLNDLKFDDLLNQLNGIDLNNLSSTLAGNLLKNLTGQFSDLTKQLTELTGPLGGLASQLSGALQGQLSSLTEQLGNVTDSLSDLTTSLDGLSDDLMEDEGGDISSSNSVPVYETNEDMLSDIGTTADKTTGILEQMQMEWDFFLNNEKSKMEYFKKTQDKVQEYLQKDSKGNSRIIEDWIDFFSAPGLKTAKIFHEELEKNFLCESFNDQIKEMFDPEKTVEFSEKGPGGAGCTITDTVSDINAFYDDFSQGGWLAWNQLFEPQNNFVGAYILAVDELATRQAIAKEAAKLEGLANQGFLSERECLEEGSDGICLKSKITTPGYIFAEGLAKTSFAELDYIVNSSDLEPYSEEIGNTFLDRLLKEIQGFLEMESSESRSEAPADAVCAFIKDLFGEEAYKACKAMIESGNNILDFVKQTGRDNIQKIANYKTQALGFKQSTLTTLDLLISTLEQLLTCQQTTNAQTEQTKSAIAAAKQFKTLIEGDIKRIQQEITETEKALSELEALTDLTEIIEKNQELKSLYDAKEALHQKNDAQKENENVAELLNEAKTDLANCLANTQQ